MKALKYYQKKLTQERLGLVMAKRKRGQKHGFTRKNGLGINCCRLNKNINYMCPIGQFTQE